MVHEELVGRLNDRGYKNWLKAGRCLLILRDGLYHFIDFQLQRFHEALLKQHSELRTPCESSCRPRGNQLSGLYRVCTQWQKVILRHHRQSDVTVNWSNCFPPTWRTDHWEVAKAYMPRGQGKVKRTHRFDASALLNLINYCDCFQSVEPALVKEVIRCRNELMHSCEMHMEDEWMRQYQIILKNFVQQLSHVPQMAKTGQEIYQMLTIDLSISVPGSDHLDSAELDELEQDCVHQWSADADLISQWELEVLQERLQELLCAAADIDDNTKTQDTEQLRMLAGFLQANRDLGKKFSAELEAITSLEARQ